MPNHACPAMPRGSWQRSTTRLSAALYTHVSSNAASVAPGSGKAVRLATSTDEDEAEAEASNRPGALSRWSAAWSGVADDLT